MLAIEQYQFLQIDTPVVPPEELRSAARYQVRDMLQTHVDDVTLDVVRVGDGKQHTNPHSFVVAATNAVVRSSMALADAMDWRVSVIDVQEMAQRNLQSTLVRAQGQSQQANAALVLLPGHQALLTICANDELFYTRRFDVPDGFLTGEWGQSVAPRATPNDAYTPVEEYVPDYAGDADLNYRPFEPVANTALGDAVSLSADKAQRMVVEVQRSLDVWDRTWSSLPLGQLRVYAGQRSAELAQWLSSQLGQTVMALEVDGLFSGLDAAALAEHPLCLPLLGLLLRTEGGKS
jgi:MSHA biogenesis protein MshI